MREIRPSGSEGGARSIPCPYPYPGETRSTRAPFSTHAIRNPSPRNPKEARSPNSETMHGDDGNSSATLPVQARLSDFGLRISFGFRGFALRISRSPHAPPRATCKLQLETSNLKLLLGWSERPGAPISPEPIARLHPMEFHIKPRPIAIGAFGSERVIAAGVTRKLCRQTSNSLRSAGFNYSPRLIW